MGLWHVCLVESCVIFLGRGLHTWARTNHLRRYITIPLCKCKEKDKKQEKGKRKEKWKQVCIHTITFKLIIIRRPKKKLIIILQISVNYFFCADGQILYVNAEYEFIFWIL